MLSNKLSFLVLPMLVTLSIQANDPLKDPFFQDPFGDDIFKEMKHMQQNMDKMFDKMHQRMQQGSSALLNPLSAYKLTRENNFVDNNGMYEFKTNIPEHQENEIDIKTENGNMSISAKIVEKQENNTGNTYSSSSSVRMYQQSVPLPQDADEGTLNAEYKDAKLIIRLKKKSTRSKIIKTPQQSNKTRQDNIAKEAQVNMLML